MKGSRLLQTMMAPPAHRATSAAALAAVPVLKKHFGAVLGVEKVTHTEAEFRQYMAASVAIMNDQTALALFGAAMVDMLMAHWKAKIDKAAAQALQEG